MTRLLLEIVCPDIKMPIKCSLHFESFVMAPVLAFHPLAFEAEEVVLFPICISVHPSVHVFLHLAVCP